MVYGTPKWRSSMQRKRLAAGVAHPGSYMAGMLAAKREGRRLSQKHSARNGCKACSRGSVAMKARRAPMPCPENSPSLSNPCIWQQAPRERLWHTPKRGAGRTGNAYATAMLHAIVVAAHIYVAGTKIRWQCQAMLGRAALFSAAHAKRNLSSHYFAGIHARSAHGVTNMLHAGSHAAGQQRRQRLSPVACCCRLFYARAKCFVAHALR